MTTNSGPSLLGEWLVAAGHIAQNDLDQALREQAHTGLRIGSFLMSRGWVTGDMVARALARQLSLEHLAAPLEASAEALAVLDESFARRHRVLPVALTHQLLRLAMVDPLDVDTTADVRFRCGRKVEVVVVAEQALDEAMDRAWGTEVERLVDAVAAIPATARLETNTATEGHGPVIRLVDRLIDEAIGAGASDVHIEPHDDHTRIRLRIDGVLRERHRVPTQAGSALVSRLKVVAGLDISVRRRPQDGGMAQDREGTRLALRVSSLPTIAGEKLVLRILDPDRAPQGLRALGLSSDDRHRLGSLLDRGQGVLLTAGPTGSGKSSTLQAALRELDRSALNVITLEDPVEYRIPGVTHVQVSPQSGLTFPVALRAVLRQDPDVLMVGEIRDRETAEIAMTAAITGHLVLSTIHTPDAPAAVTRLLHMGVPPHLVAGGLAGVVAQRLVRRSCSRCSGAHPLGCSACHQGFRGRTGVFQVLEVDEPLREAIARGAPLAELRELARSGGMRSLADDARRLIAEGRSVAHETARVLGKDQGSGRPCEHCGGPVPHTATVCPWCAHPHRAHCSCGQLFESGWRWCPGCSRPRPSANGVIPLR